MKKKIKIGIASDHAGFSVKEKIKQYLLNSNNIIIKDYGTNSLDSVDYPDYAKKIAKSLQKGIIDKGILICKTGIGMSIAANRFKGIRAALCYDKESTILSRKHNDSNILILPAYLFENSKDLEDILNLWLTTDFEGGRHLKRLKKINNL